MRTFLKNAWTLIHEDEKGQDLIEYSLLMAFVLLAAAALYLGAGGSIKGIWSSNPPACVAGQTSTAEKLCTPPPAAPAPTTEEKK